MTNGINDTRAVKETVGKNLRAARGNLSRQAFVDILNECSDVPIRNGKRDSVSVERLKQWEYGNNPVDIEWIPLLCRVLSIDVGYLFGEYLEHTRIKSDVVKETGLTEAAVSVLFALKEDARRLPNATSADILKTIDLLLKEDYWNESREYWRRLAAFLFAKGGGLTVPLSTGINLTRDDVMSGLLLKNNSYLLKLKDAVCLTVGGNENG